MIYPESLLGEELYLMVMGEKAKQAALEYTARNLANPQTLTGKMMIDFENILGKRTPRLANCDGVISRIALRSPGLLHYQPLADAYNITLKNGDSLISTIDQLSKNYILVCKETKPDHIVIATMREYSLEEDSTDKHEQTVLFTIGDIIPEKKKRTLKTPSAF